MKIQVSNLFTINYDPIKLFIREDRVKIKLKYSLIPIPIKRSFHKCNIKAFVSQRSTIDLNEIDENIADVTVIIFLVSHRKKQLLVKRFLNFMHGKQSTFVDQMFMIPPWH